MCRVTIPMNIFSEQYFSPAGDFAPLFPTPREHVAMSENIFGGQSSWGDIQWVEARMLLDILQYTEKPPQRKMTCPKISVVLGM